MGTNYPISPAFSPACSAAHIAKYIEAKVDVPTYVVAINDPFVTKVCLIVLLFYAELGR